MQLSHRVTSLRGNSLDNVQLTLETQTGSTTLFPYAVVLPCKHTLMLKLVELPFKPSAAPAHSEWNWSKILNMCYPVYVICEARLKKKKKKKKKKKLPWDLVFDPSFQISQIKWKVEYCKNFIWKKSTCPLSCPCTVLHEYLLKLTS